MSSAAKEKAGGPPLRRAEHVEILRVLVEERPVCSLEALRRALVERSGVSVRGPTLRKGLQEAGVVCHQAPRGGGETADARPPQRRSGHTDRHR